MPYDVQRMHEYWRDPSDKRFRERDNKGRLVNVPETYTQDERLELSAWLAMLMLKHVDKDASVLEIGCNAGRNLSVLSGFGYANLMGIDISMNALRHGLSIYPALCNALLMCGPIEELIEALHPHDCIFTVATLMHIADKSKWVLDEIASRAKVLITVELEIPKLHPRYWQRDYREVFEARDMRQVHQDVPPVLEGYTARVFAKE